MKNEENIFHLKNIDLFMPNDGVEYIYSILQNLGYHDFTTRIAREHGLNTIRQLFELDLIEVFSWGKHQNLFSNLDFTAQQKMKLIENIWFVGADFSDFVEMVMFKHKDWYLKELVNEGLQTTGVNWKTFVDDRIGDLENWINQNRPK